jgi:hypothetical protein
MKIRFMYSVSKSGLQLHNQEAILEVYGGLGQHGTPTPNQLLEPSTRFARGSVTRGDT